MIELEQTVALRLALRMLTDEQLLQLERLWEAEFHVEQVPAGPDVKEANPAEQDNDEADSADWWKAA